MITMIWTFSIMTIFFAGALLNVYFGDFNEKRKNRKRTGGVIKEEEILIRDIEMYGDPKVKKKRR